MKAKNVRQDILIHLIQSHRISSQEELKIALLEQGIVTAQATLSRDMREIGIVKRHDAQGYYYVLTASTPNKDSSEGPHATVQSGILSVEGNGPLAVLKTLPGHAGMIAAHIDAFESEHILGTIAGDDTLLIILRENVDLKTAIASLTPVLPGIAHKIV